MNRFFFLFVFYEDLIISDRDVDFSHCFDGLYIDLAEKLLYLDVKDSGLESLTISCFLFSFFSV